VIWEATKCVCAEHLFCSREREDVWVGQGKQARYNVYAAKHF